VKTLFGDAEAVFLRFVDEKVFAGAILNGLEDMLFLNVAGALEIRNGAGEFNDAVIGARGEV